VGEYDGDRAFAGRYLVQASAQACIDIANHVIASSGWRAPTDFRDAFTVLQEEGALDSDLAERMRTLAGLRNRIVHSSLKEGLNDLSMFAQAMADLAERG
jgi:uncharacterized protein YutE (UPF0331/DUF86 family)